MKSFIQKQRGMSIVDTMVYIAVLVILTSAAVTAIFSLNTVFERNKSERVLTDAATMVLERFTRDVRDADTVNLLLSTLAASSSVVVLENSATTTTYSVTDGKVMLDVEGVSYGALTPDAVLVQNFSVVRYAGTQSDALRLTLDLATYGKFASTTEKFYSTVVLRGSYEE